MLVLFCVQDAENIFQDGISYLIFRIHVFIILKEMPNETT